MTDNITLPRATVVQALETLLEGLYTGKKERFEIALRTLSAALVQPEQQAEPIGWLDGNDKLAYFMHRDLKADHDKRGSATPREYTIPVYAAPPQQQAEPVQEPYESPYNPNAVEYQYHYPDGSWSCSNGEVINGMHPDRARSLYALKDNT